MFWLVLGYVSGLNAYDRIKKGQALKAIRIQNEFVLENLKKDYYRWGKYNAKLLLDISTTDVSSDEETRKNGAERYVKRLGNLVVKKGTVITAPFLWP